MSITLVGSAAPTVGDLVSTTNPAGEILFGLIWRVIAGRRTALTQAPDTYEVRVGGPKGTLRTWSAADCTYATPESAAAGLYAGESVYVRVGADWVDADVVEVHRTRVKVRRMTRNGEREYTVPAWAIMRSAW